MGLYEPLRAVADRMRGVSTGRRGVMRSIFGGDRSRRDTAWKDRAENAPPYETEPRRSIYFPGYGGPGIESRYIGAADHSLPDKGSIPVETRNPETRDFVWQKAQAGTEVTLDDDVSKIGLNEVERAILSVAGGPGEDEEVRRPSILDESRPGDPARDSISNDPYSGDFGSRYMLDLDAVRQPTDAEIHGSGVSDLDWLREKVGYDVPLDGNELDIAAAEITRAIANIIGEDAVFGEHGQPEPGGSLDSNDVLNVADAGEPDQLMPGAPGHQSQESVSYDQTSPIYELTGSPNGYARNAAEIDFRTENTLREISGIPAASGDSSEAQRDEAQSSLETIADYRATDLDQDYIPDNQHLEEISDIWNEIPGIDAKNDVEAGEEYEEEEEELYDAFVEI